MLLADVIAAGLDVVIPPPADFDLAGFSFGGIIAGLVAARLARRVRTLVLLGAGALALPPIPMPTLRPITPGSTPAEIMHAHRENLGLLMIADARRIDDLAVFVQMENLRRARFKSGTIPISEVLLNALPAIRARITGIWAARDAFSGARAERVDEHRRILATVQPDLDFRVIRDAGHWIPFEAPDAVNAALLDMLCGGSLDRQDPSCNTDV